MEFNSRICTTLEQSERLLALGLKKETADMMFIVLVKDFRGKDVPKAERVYSLCTWYEETSMRVGFEKREYIPAWSLHRLIEMADTYIEFSPFTGVTFQDGSFSTNRDNDYDAIVDIIEWLIQKDHFNKEYLEE